MGKTIELYGCIINYSMHELLVRKAYSGGLMGHFKITKILKIYMNIFIGLT
jgi:hypothetical protein